MFNFFKKKVKTDKELDFLVNGVENNMANNYKDEAHRFFREFLILYKERLDSNALTDKQIEYYDSKKKEFEDKLKDYSHRLNVDFL